MAQEDLLLWCDDLHQVRGNISQLQATLNHVLAKAPTVSQYKELVRVFDDGTPTGSNPAPHLLEKLRASLNSPQVKVAVRLKSLYDRGYLPFLLALTRINFKSTRADRYVGYLLDYNPPKGANVTMEEPLPVIKQDNEAPLYPPSLPPIEDKLLLKLALTDKSLRQPSDYLELSYEDGFHDFNNNHNRKLSIKGATLLDLALVEILDDKFPKAHEDDLQYLKHRLTSTHILAKLAYCYSLSDVLLHHVSQELSLADKQAVFKNAFLAYVGAMSKDKYSYPEIRGWIQKLYEPIIARLAEDCKEQDQLKDINAVAYAEFQFLMTRVNNYFETPTKKIRYEFATIEEDPAVAQLQVGELTLGTGTGSTYAEAKNKAAYATFNDKALCSQLFAHILENFKTVEKTKEEIPEPVEAKEETISDDEAYSPGLSPDEEPEAAKSAFIKPPPAAPSGPPPAPAARMPLAYGMLPPIPNMKKRNGEAKRR